MAYRTIEIKLADGRTITKRIDERGIVPAGGTSGQSLNKQSDTDFDVDWSDATDPRLTDSKNPHGHLTYDDTFTTLSFDESTRTVTISPVPTSPMFKYYIDSVAYTTTEQSVVFPDVEGTHFIYLDTDGLLKSTQSFDVAGAKCFTAVLYWDATNKLIIYKANERHSVAFDHADWKYKHLTFGTQWRSGSGITGITADGDGDVDSSATFTVESGVIDDEDIRHLLPQQTIYDIFYKLGANGDWRRSDIGTAYGVHYNGTRATYNQFTGGAWQLTTVGNLNYVLAHVFATNNLLRPYIVVMGQNQYTTIGNARAGVNVEMNNLITNGLPFQEFVPVASIIYQTSNGYANAVRSRIRSTDTGDDYVNWLGQELSPTITPAAHNNLTGLQLAGTGVIWGHIDESIFNLIPTVDQNAAIDGANSPSSSNVFATMDDIPSIPSVETYVAGDGIVIVDGSPDKTISLGGAIDDYVTITMGANSALSVDLGDASTFTILKQSANDTKALTFAAGNTEASVSFATSISDANQPRLQFMAQAPFGVGDHSVQMVVTENGLRYEVTDDVNAELDAISGWNSESPGWLPHKRYVDRLVGSVVPAVVGYFGRATGGGVGKINFPTSTGQKIFFVEGIVVGSPATIIDTFNLSTVTGSQMIIRFINETGLRLASGSGNLGFDITIPSAYHEIKCEYDGLIWQLVDMNESSAFSIGVSCISYNPSDNQSVAIGIDTQTPGTTFDIQRIYLPVNCKLVGASFFWRAATSAGSGENISIYIRRNNSTDTLVQTVGNTSATKLFTNSALDVDFTAGDYFEVKVTQPTWATNPTGVRIFGNVVFKPAAGSIKYTTMQMSFISQNAITASTCAIGIDTQALAPGTGGTLRMYVPFACTIRAVYGFWRATTAGSAENNTFNIRVNNTTSYLVKTVGDTNAIKIFDNTSMNVSLNAGDYFEGEMVFATPSGAGYVQPLGITFNAIVVLSID